MHLLQKAFIKEDIKITLVVVFNPPESFDNVGFLLLLEKNWLYDTRANRAIRQPCPTLPEGLEHQGALSAWNDWYGCSSYRVNDRFCLGVPITVTYRHLKIYSLKVAISQVKLCNLHKRIPWKCEVDTDKSYTLSRIFYPSVNIS